MWAVRRSALSRRRADRKKVISTFLARRPPRAYVCLPQVRCFFGARILARRCATAAAAKPQTWPHRGPHGYGFAIAARVALVPRRIPKARRKRHWSSFRAAAAASIYIPGQRLSALPEQRRARHSVSSRITFRDSRLAKVRDLGAASAANQHARRECGGRGAGPIGAAAAILGGIELSSRAPRIRRPHGVSSLPSAASRRLP